MNNKMISNYHTHTKRCGHAAGEDKEYVEAAIRGNIKVLGFSDHCPWIFPDDFHSTIRMSLSEVDGYFHSLEELKREYKDDIDIKIGFEEEYMPDLIPAQDHFLEGYPVDYRILGQHFVGPECGDNYAGNPTRSEEMLKGYVDLCLEGMATGRYKYLAHPDLIHYVGDDAIYEREMRRLCEGIWAMEGILEINALGIAGGRNYPDAGFWKIAAETGNQAMIGMDAHTPEQLINREAEERAREIGKDVLILN